MKMFNLIISVWQLNYTFRHFKTFFLPYVIWHYQYCSLLRIEGLTSSYKNNTYMFIHFKTTWSGCIHKIWLYTLPIRVILKFQFKLFVLTFLYVFNYFDLIIHIYIINYCCNSPSCLFIYKRKKKTLNH